ncbi:MAG: SRPBCC family protein [Nitriliruptoraceae bacterium]
MPRISAPLSVPIPPEVAFDNVADFTTTAVWDSGIAATERLDDGPLGVGSRFEVQYKFGPVTRPLVYEITTYDRPHRVVLETKGLLYRGEDDVTFAPEEHGTRVTWNASFRLRGPARLLDPVLGIGFRRNVADAVEGLEPFLRELSTQ